MVEMLHGLRANQAAAAGYKNGFHTTHRRAIIILLDGGILRESKR